MNATMTDTNERLWRLIEPWLAAERLELDDLELAGSGRVQILRVVVDAEEGPDLDRLAEVSEGISRLLDTETDLQGPYQLEVTSPGLERKLKRPRHFEKSVGREVSAKVRREGGGSRVVKGVLQDAGASGFVVATDDGEETIPYDQVLSASTVFTWERSPKPGKK